MAVKMNFRIITKNDATDPEIGFLTKSISKPNGCATAMSTAWEIRANIALMRREIVLSKLIFRENKDKLNYV